MSQQIVLNSLNKPVEKNIEEGMIWIGKSFSLNSGRDTKKVTMNLFKKVLTNEQILISSSNLLVNEFNLSRGVVNYHLHSLINSSLLCRETQLSRFGAED